MPIVESDFRPPLFLRNGHVQTILPVLLPRRFSAIFQRERLELADGDFLDLDWLCTGQRRLAIISHGLEGSSKNGYVRGTATALHAAGWDVLAWNYRGCSDEPNRLARFYHSGETRDLSAVIARAAQDYSAIVLVGFSLGGNITLKYLGETQSHPAVMGGAAISTPVDLASSARALDSRLANRIYLRRFMDTLVAKVEAKATRFPEELDVTGLNRVGTFAEFDDRFTARLHGFRDATDYWQRSSARFFLSTLTVPTLLINALDDPFLAPLSFPYEEAKQNPLFYFEAPAHGGHVGFLDLTNGLQPWFERRLISFFGTIPQTSPHAISDWRSGQ